MGSHYSSECQFLVAKTMPSTHFKAYGLGWAHIRLPGRKIIGHGGGYDGFITNTTFIPEENLGFVILTNKNTSLYYPLKYKILDVLLGAEEEEDWSEMFLEFMQEGTGKRRNGRAGGPGPRKKSKPSLKQEDYLGTYHCEMYGDANVYMDGDQMMVQLLPADFFIGHLNHWQYNTWQVELLDVPLCHYGLVNFIIDDQGNVVEMEIDIPNPDFYFTELEFLKSTVDQSLIISLLRIC